MFLAPKDAYFCWDFSFSKTAVFEKRILALDFYRQKSRAKIYTIRERQIMGIENRVGLPKTTPTRYLTGMTALNIPAPEGTTGDWHFEESFWGRNGRVPKFFVAGEGAELNTNSIWGALGIYDCSNILRAKGIAIAAEENIYAANHCRAVLDMLYNAIQHKEYPHHITVDDWLDMPKEKKRLFDSLSVLNGFLEEDEKIILNSWLEAK